MWSQTNLLVLLSSVYSGHLGRIEWHIILFVSGSTLKIGSFHNLKPDFPGWFSGHYGTIHSFQKWTNNLLKDPQIKRNIEEWYKFVTGCYNIKWPTVKLSRYLLGYWEKNDRIYVRFRWFLLFCNFSLVSNIFSIMWNIGFSRRTPGTS